MYRQQFNLALGVLLSICWNASYGQPLVDRVIDRVQGEVNGRLRPIPVEDGAITNPNQPLVQDNEPGYLGIVADDRQEQGKGVRILDVVEGGPAAQGGLTKNDLITAIDTTPIRSMDEMARILSAYTCRRNGYFWSTSSGGGCYGGGYFGSAP